MNTQIHDNYLKKAINNKTPITVYLMNGFQMRGTITGFDDIVITIVAEQSGKEQAVYRHAISTFMPRG